MPQALAVVSLIGTVVSVIGAIQGGNAAKAQADAEANALRQQAANAKAKSKLDAADFRRSASRRAAATRAAEGAAGLRIGSGSSLLAAEDFGTRAAAQEERIKLGGDIEANRLGAQASLTEFAGKSAQRASRFRAGSSLLKGAASFGSGFSNSSPPPTKVTSISV